jgi:site-specific DNA-cytosine methylase
MKHGSLFAGIDSFDLAMHRCGIKTVWAAEEGSQANSVRRRWHVDSSGDFPETDPVDLDTAIKELLEQQHEGTDAEAAVSCLAKHE